MKKVSIILPAYNEAESLPLVKDRMEAVALQNTQYEWEFLFVNDGSTDESSERMALLHRADSRFNYVDLARNYGKEIALLAGFDYATGDATIVMDADMQHPIDVIPEMLRYWEDGYDDIYAQRKTSNEGWLKKNTSKLYYRVLQGLTRIPIQKDAGDFRLLDRSCVEALKSMRESERNTKGLYSWIGFKKKRIFYHQLERKYGHTKWSLFGLMGLALNGLMAYSIFPLRFASIAGSCVSAGAFCYLLHIVLKTLFFDEPVAGFPTIMVTILFLGGIQLLCLGVIGEYLGRVFMETKQRPSYFVSSYNGKRDKLRRN